MMSKRAILTEARPPQAPRGLVVLVLATVLGAIALTRERAQNYLSKPLRRAALGALIHRWLRPDAPRKEPHCVRDGRRAETRGASQLVQDVLDLATISQLRDTLAPEMRQQLIDTFDEHEEKCVADISAAVQRGDRDALRRLAHLLKGSAASLGAMRLRECCERLEHTGRSQDSTVGDTQIAQLHDVAAEARQALRQRLA